MPALDIPYDDYRTSHQGKGEDYQNRFSGASHRALMWRIEQRILKALLHKHFAEPGQVRLLDFACGTGRILRLLESDVGTATGVDVAQSMLDVAKRHVQKARLLCADITKADDLDDQRFDLITAFRFFPNAEPALRDEAMAKLVALLAPGGLLMFNNHLRLDSARHRALLAKDRRGRLKNRRRLHGMSDREVADLAARHGLEIVESRHLGVLPVTKEQKPLRFSRLALGIERLAARSRLLAPLAGLKIHVLRQR
ncbi:MAG: class I SAM-dependent methyltransferase [Pseudomonadota bacterium]